MKKKILFMMINMNVGGMEKALLNMISAMPKNKYDITIYMLEEYGGFLKTIPKEVRIEYFSGYENMKDLLNQPPQFMALKLFKQHQMIKAGIILLLHVISKILMDRSIYFKYLLRNYPIINQKYDIAIAYAGPNDFISYFVINKINAKQKFQWVHFDITKIGFNRRFSMKIYKKFDGIFVVSNEAKTKLLNMLPSIKGKTIVFQNIVSPSLILNQAKEGKGFNDHFGGIRILTVGRLSAEKGQDLAIKALAKLKNDGFNVRWYCVGDGNSRGEYESLIKKYNVQSHFILLGSDPNPYPYMDQCDIYVQPSRYEGYCITLMEARCLKKPIVTTDVNGVKEQIQDGESGLIVGIDVDEIYLGIRKLISDIPLRERFSTKLSNEDFTSFDQMEKLNGIIN
ncbi:glycosyltransferase [Bacillus salipaludis]|uniref:Glycosyltransferase n=1 Tax=Bacillus salipaludis TaxID=2547811 RepID=A0ABW8R920_9BACI